MYTLDNIEITHDSSDNNYLPYVSDKLDEYYHKVLEKKPNQKTITDLIKLIKRFPDVAPFYNYLQNTYVILGKEEKSVEILDITLKKHPNYIFAISKKIEDLVKDDKVDEAAALLKDCENINEFYTEKTVFHHTEVKAFYTAAFFIEVGSANFKEARNIIDLLKHLDEDLTNVLNKEFLFFQMKNSFLFNKQDNDIKPSITKRIEAKDYEDQPTLTNPNLALVYTEKIDIAFIQTLKLLDRTSVIEDLLIILKNITKRYHYFYNTEDDYNEFCAIDTLIIIKELEAKDALNTILDFISHDDEFLWFWLGDFKTETLWQVFFAIASEQLDVLKDFLKQPSIDTYAKSAVSNAITQIYYHYPEKRLEVKQIWIELLNYYTTLKVEDNIIDSTFFAFFIGDIFDGTKTPYIDKIKTLYNNNWIDCSIHGDFNMFVKDAYTETIKKIATTQELLDIWNNTDHELEYPNEANNYKTIAPQPIQQSTKKIGRNDPCPCASGKKYKKCCL